MRWSNLTVMGRLIILTLLALAAIGVLGAQDGKPASAAKELKPSEVQYLRLQVRQKDALLAKANLEQAQRQFQQALTDLSNEGEKIKLEQGWPKDTQFSPNDLTFTPAPVVDMSKPTGPPVVPLSKEKKP